MKHNRKGFTIVELVIVIAVIAVLAAVLIPTFSGVLGKANASAAQQMAMNAIKAGLLMTSTASLPDNTFVIVSNDSNAAGKPTYLFKYSGNAMESIEAYDSEKAFQYTNLNVSDTLLVSDKVITSSTSGDPAVTTYALTDAFLTTLNYAVSGAATGFTAAVDFASGVYTITLTKDETTKTFQAYTSVDISEDVAIFVDMQ